MRALRTIIPGALLLLAAWFVGVPMYQHAAQFPVSPGQASAQATTSFTPQAFSPQNPQAYPQQYVMQPKDKVTDPWGQRNRECSSYVAWRVDATFHDMPRWDSDGIYKYFGGHEPTSLTQRPSVSWVDLAKAYNIPVGSMPEQDSVAYATPGTYLGGSIYAGDTAHVMWVDAVEANGTIDISEYNSDGDGAYHKRYGVPADHLTFIYFNRNYTQQQQALRSASHENR
jgi:hypothetical protein